MTFSLNFLAFFAFVGSFSFLKNVLYCKICNGMTENDVTKMIHRGLSKTYLGFDVHFDYFDYFQGALALPKGEKTWSILIKFRKTILCVCVCATK